MEVFSVHSSPRANNEKVGCTANQKEGRPTSDPHEGQADTGRSDEIYQQDDLSSSPFDQCSGKGQSGQLGNPNDHKCDGRIQVAYSPSNGQIANPNGQPIVSESLAKEQERSRDDLSAKNSRFVGILCVDGIFGGSRNGRQSSPRQLTAVPARDGLEDLIGLVDAVTGQQKPWRFPAPKDPPQEQQDVWEATSKDEPAPLWQKEDTHGSRIKDY